MYKPLIYLISLVLLISCKEKQAADLIVFNANIYTVDKDFSKAEAFAVSDGKFVGVGSDKEIKRQFRSEQIYDAQGQTIVPGLIDGHCHFYGLGWFLQEVDLTGTKSFQEVLDRIRAFKEERNPEFIVGRGWDQNDWESKEYPDKSQLDALYPNTPVVLSRIDGHAMLVNQKALDLSGIDRNSRVEGGEIVQKYGEPTGVLVDNAMLMVENILPEPGRASDIKALMDAQEFCFARGLTTVSDAGLDRRVIALIDSLQRSGDLKMRIYAMVSASKKNLDYYLQNGIYQTDRLNVRSFKVYADGALGSRGAVLKQPYSDRPGHFGAMVTHPDSLQTIASRIANSEFQMNTHAIGDSANAFVLKTYAHELKSRTNRRWRIEHAQVIDPADLEYFTEILPSVQPTHATSDMYWAGERLGEERIHGAYAFKDMLRINGRIVLGTDFPVEKVDPLLTFHAAVSRKDLTGYPEGGFEMRNGLNRQETLQGMTIWAAYANFEEKSKGSVEQGKFADFVVLDRDIMQVPIEEVPNIGIVGTYISGEKVN